MFWVMGLLLLLGVVPIRLSLSKYWRPANVKEQQCRERSSKRGVRRQLGAKRTATVALLCRVI